MSVSNISCLTFLKEYYNQKIKGTGVSSERVSNPFKNISEIVKKLIN